MEKDDLEVLAMSKDVSEFAEDRFPGSILTFVKRVGASEVCLLSLADRVSDHTE
jgi:hypothetical protein